MAGFLLNSQSVLMCPHGGSVGHIPGTFTAHRVQGSPPMLLSDNYLISGCPYMMPMGSAMVPMPCSRVQWLTGSPMMLVKGTPVLTNESTGICVAANGMPNGPVMIVSFQVQEQEPKEFTTVKD